MTRSLRAEVRQMKQCGQFEQADALHGLPGQAPAIDDAENPFSQRDPRRSFVEARCELRKSSSLSTTRHLLLSSLTKEEEAERRQTLIRILRILRCGSRLLRRAHLTAFHHGSHLRELFHPKGSASGQASWDAVCTGVTRLRLSQSRDAPPTPVVMPGDMMPKPPESELQIRPRAPHPLHLTACLRGASSERAGFGQCN